MKLSIEIAGSSPSSREAVLRFDADELVAVHLHLAFPERRNRSGLYMRRHAHRPDEPVGPNQPLHSPQEPPKLSIPQHVEQMRRAGLISLAIPPPPADRQSHGEERTMIAVGIADLVANLLRPCFHRDRLGEHRLFYLDEEPIDRRTYHCLCCFAPEGRPVRLQFRRVRFDRQADRAIDASGGDLLEEGLLWAAALVPLVADGQPLGPVPIAQADYDLRQIVGRATEGPIRYAYQGWFDRWDARVEEIVSTHQQAERPWETFYHSVLGLDAAGNAVIRQKEATLPDLADSLASEGIVAAGLLDSGGSSAIYDVWSASYLNHGWYYRRPRGAILLFEFRWTRRLPEDWPSLWTQRRADVEDQARRRLDQE
ncbi:MAG: hypothetical protein HQ582_20965 [Planctomycetes bacterium]|nr:hypothetical protein [Planctomycetota bacterium]